MLKKKNKTKTAHIEQKTGTSDFVEMKTHGNTCVCVWSALTHIHTSWIIKVVIFHREKPKQKQRISLAFDVRATHKCRFF